MSTENTNNFAPAFSKSGTNDLEHVGSNNTLECRETVYVPNIYYGEPHKLNSNIIGVFKNKKDAIKILIKELVELNFISFDNYFDDLCHEEDDEEHDEEAEKIIFITKLTNEILIENKTLEFICKKYNNSYYKEGWNCKIDEHTISL